MSSGLTTQQHLDRSGRIGASEIAAICGLDPFQTPYDVWLLKTKRAAREESSEAMHFGTVLEEVVAQEFARRRDRRVQRWSRGYTHGEHLIAHLDRIIVGTREILQCKTANAWADWIREPALPAHYRIQLEQELLCSERDTEHLACLVGGQQYRDWLDVHPSPALTDAIVMAGDDFMVKHVKADTPPAPLRQDDFAKMYRRGDTGRNIDLPKELRPVLRALVEAKAERKLLDTDIGKMELQVKTVIGANSGLQAAEHDKPAVTWKAQNKTYRDEKKLAAALVELAGGMPDEIREAALVIDHPKLVDGMLLHIEATGDDAAKLGAGALLEHFTLPARRTFLTKPKIIETL